MIDDGLPPLAVAAVLAHLRHGAAKHGATTATSSPDQDALCHWLSLLRHVARVQDPGYADLSRRDPDSEALHLTAVVCRGLLALECVLREGGRG